MTPYLCGLLKPLRASNAQAHNSALLGASTLGIEVTEPELAAGCRLGNIDPQHLGRRPDRAAIDDALDWPLPPRGTRLVTIRPDADALGAMAVLTIRSEETALAHGAYERIAILSEADRFACGPWPGVRAVPRRVDEVSEVGSGLQDSGAIIGGALSATMTLEAKVLAIKKWILAGIAPCEWVAEAAVSATSLLSALEQGAVTVRDVVPGVLALVEGVVPAGLRLGYRRAPLIMAVTSDPKNSALQRKVTIAQYRPGYADLVATARKLSLDEPGWGGSDVIIGSPQGVACRTSIEDCIEALLSSRAQQ